MTRVRGDRWGESVARFAGRGLALVVLLLAGCDSAMPDGYDPNLTYPLRSDPLVLELPKTAPTKPADAGRFDASIATLPTLGGKLANPASLSESHRLRLRESLDALFGTPADPKLAFATAPPTLGDLDLSPATLKDGSRHYRRLCAQCHGLTGDGRGITGPWIYPHPRDFRQGVYKLPTGTAKPTIAAMTRTLRRGITGSSMPLFDLISDDEVRSILAYTIHLGVRGEVEFRVMRDCLDESGERDVTDVSAECERQAERVLSQWVAAQSAPPPSPIAETADPDSLRRGHDLFTKTAGCASCHQDFGRTEAYRYDVWGGAARITDVTQGKFRWGGESADLAARIRHGIPAAGMPANPALTDEQVRDLVAFLREAGHPHKLPDDVRAPMFPPSK